MSYHSSQVTQNKTKQKKPLIITNECCQWGAKMFCLSIFVLATNSRIIMIEYNHIFKNIMLTTLHNQRAPIECVLPNKGNGELLKT